MSGGKEGDKGERKVRVPGRTGRADLKEKKMLSPGTVIIFKIHYSLLISYDVFSPFTPTALSHPFFFSLTSPLLFSCLFVYSVCDPLNLIRVTFMNTRGFMGSLLETNLQQ